ncbi:MAG: hypothetical protein J5997_10970 [Oscillospiraceae bacterium]|nr:hypothetical protein [Oscillospiraceae bacterium]
MSLKTEAAGCIFLPSLIAEYGLEGYYSDSRTVGADGNIYLFFKEDGIRTKHDRSLLYSYAAVRLFPDWYGGDVASELLPLGEYRDRLSGIHPIAGRLLLLGRDDKNAIGIILDERLKEQSRISFGISYFDKALITAGGRICLGEIEENCFSPAPVSIFDEYGNRERIERFSHWDVTALNIDENGDIWYYAYPDNGFFSTGGEGLKYDGAVYNFAVLPGRRGIIADTGGSFRLLRFNGQSEEAVFTYGGREIAHGLCSFRENRGVILCDDELYFFCIN